VYWQAAERRELSLTTQLSSLYISSPPLTMSDNTHTYDNLHLSDTISPYDAKLKQDRKRDTFAGILDYHITDNNVFFYCAWVGFDDSEGTWHPHDRVLRDFPDEVYAFEQLIVFNGLEYKTN